MMYKQMQGVRKMAVVSLTAMLFAFPLGSCDLGEFTSTSTVTLSGREVVSYLVRSLVLTPIQTALDQGIDRFFDEFEDEDA